MKAEFYLEHFNRYKEEGLDAYHSGDGKEARFKLLKASEFLYKLAKLSDGKIREKRIENATRLMKMARSIDPTSGKLPKRATAAGDAGEGSEEGKKFEAVERPTSPTFSDIAGLEEAKEQIRLRLIYPFIHEELAQDYKIRTGGGILFYGPPGTGKTMLARAVAAEIDAAFFSVKPSEIMSKYVGEAEQNIANLFKTARECERSVIFIDEIESMVPARSESQSAVMQRVVPQILAELEGFDSAKETSALLFVGATNEPWQLDPAVMRPGRFDERIYIGLPDEPARWRIMELNLDGLPLDPDVDLDELAVNLEGYSGADIRNICRKAADAAFLVAIREGEGDLINQADILRVIKETPPSVTAEILKRFDDYRKEMNLE